VVALSRRDTAVIDGVIDDSHVPRWAGWCLCGVLGASTARFGRPGLPVSVIQFTYKNPSVIYRQLFTAFEFFVLLSIIQGIG
jgi:hypothetical protein